MSIQRNLHDFLVELRLLDRPRAIWVDAIWADAICINQKDAVERNAQVALTRDIYSIAQCALLWLGQYEIGSDELLDFFFGAVASKTSSSVSGDSVTEQDPIVQTFDDLMRSGCKGDARGSSKRSSLLQISLCSAAMRVFRG